MQLYLWIGVKCKTPGCFTFNLIQYEGPFVGQVEIGANTPTGIHYQCAACQKAHYYRIPEDTEMKPLPNPRPDGWKNVWPSIHDQPESKSRKN